MISLRNQSLSLGRAYGDPMNSNQSAKFSGKPVSDRKSP